MRLASICQASAIYAQADKLALKKTVISIGSEISIHPSEEKTGITEI